jgi:DNA mismatch endonuclease, patch repair protein
VATKRSNSQQPSDAKQTRKKAPSKVRLDVDEKTSIRMGGVRQHGTAAELSVRRALFALGARFRTQNRDLPGSPDVANRSRHWAVFVHGCFWHRHEGCKRTTTPSRNREFWTTKFDANVQRDARAIAALEERNYDVLVIWECETEKPEILRPKLETFFSGHEVKPDTKPARRRSRSST